MIPVGFKESNKTFKGGEGVQDLKVYQDEDEIVSLWKASWLERLMILFTGYVWLSVIGSGTPPVYIKGTCMFIRKPWWKACGKCKGTGNHSSVYKGNGVNINVKCPYCKGSGFNKLWTWLAKRGIVSLMPKSKE